MDSIEWVMCRPGRYRERRSGVFPLYTRFTVYRALRAGSKGDIDSCNQIFLGEPLHAAGTRMT
jgi:hypothetical protein